MTSVRIVNVDHYMSTPILNLDVLNSEFRGSAINKLPIIRIFGSTKSGDKTCLHIHGVFPYIYIPYEGQDDRNSIVYQISTAIDKSINISLGQTSSNHQHVFKIVLVSTTPFYGYHAREHQFMKIYFYNPLILKKACNLLQNGAILGKVYQPHESHIPYIQQFMIDYNLHGMSFINLSEVKYRQSDDELGMEAIPGNQILPSTIKRVSYCKLEMDGLADHILNRLEVSDGNIIINPGIQYIRDDEMQRRRNKGLDTQLEPILTQNRVNINPTSTHNKYKILLTDKLIKKGEIPLTNPNINASVYAAETPDDESFLSASSILDHTHLENATNLDITLSNPDLDTTNAECDNSTLEEDANLLLDMLKDNEILEEDSILSQIPPKEDDTDSDSEKESDLSLPLASITTPVKIIPQVEQEATSDDEIWRDAFFDETLKIPQLDGNYDDDDTLPQPHDILDDVPLKLRLDDSYTNDFVNKARRRRSKAIKLKPVEIDLRSPQKKLRKTSSDKVTTTSESKFRDLNDNMEIKCPKLLPITETRTNNSNKAAPKHNNTIKHLSIVTNKLSFDVNEEQSKDNTLELEKNEYMSTLPETSKKFKSEISVFERGACFENKIKDTTKRQRVCADDKKSVSLDNNVDPSIPSIATNLNVEDKIICKEVRRSTRILFKCVDSSFLPVQSKKIPTDHELFTLPKKDESSITPSNAESTAVQLPDQNSNIDKGLPAADVPKEKISSHDKTGEITRRDELILKENGTDERKTLERKQKIVKKDDSLMMLRTRGSINSGVQNMGLTKTVQVQDQKSSIEKQLPAADVSNQVMEKNSLHDETEEITGGNLKFFKESGTSMKKSFNHKEKFVKKDVSLFVLRTRGSINSGDQNMGLTEEVQAQNQNSSIEKQLPIADVSNQVIEKISSHDETEEITGGDVHNLKESGTSTKKSVSHKQKVVKKDDSLMVLRTRGSINSGVQNMGLTGEAQAQNQNSSIEKHLLVADVSNQVMEKIPSHDETEEITGGDIHNLKESGTSTKKSFSHKQKVVKKDNSLMVLRTSDSINSGVQNMALTKTVPVQDQNSSIEKQLTAADVSNQVMEKIISCDKTKEINGSDTQHLKDSGTSANNSLSHKLKVVKKDDPLSMIHTGAQNMGLTSDNENSSRIRKSSRIANKGANGNNIISNKINVPEHMSLIVRIKWNAEIDQIIRNTKYPKIHTLNEPTNPFSDIQKEEQRCVDSCGKLKVAPAIEGNEIIEPPAPISSLGASNTPKSSKKKSEYTQSTEANDKLRAAKVFTRRNAVSIESRRKTDEEVIRFSKLSTKTKNCDKDETPSINTIIGDAQENINDSVNIKKDTDMVNRIRKDAAKTMSKSRLVENIVAADTTNNCSKTINLPVNIETNGLVDSNIPADATSNCSKTIYEPVNTDKDAIIINNIQKDQPKTISKDSLVDSNVAADTNSKCSKTILLTPIKLVKDPIKDEFIIVNKKYGKPISKINLSEIFVVNKKNLMEAHEVLPNNDVKADTFSSKNDPIINGHDKEDKITDNELFEFTTNGDIVSIPTTVLDFQTKAPMGIVKNETGKFCRNQLSSKAIRRKAKNNKRFVGCNHENVITNRDEVGVPGKSGLTININDLDTAFSDKAQRSTAQIKPFHFDNIASNIETKNTVENDEDGSTKVNGYMAALHKISKNITDNQIGNFENALPSESEENRTALINVQQKQFNFVLRNSTGREVHVKPIVGTNEEYNLQDIVSTDMLPEKTQQNDANGYIFDFECNAPVSENITENNFQVHNVKVLPSNTTKSPINKVMENPLTKQIEVNTNEINHRPEVLSVALHENGVKSNADASINIFEFKAPALKNITKHEIGNIKNDLDIDNFKVLPSTKSNGQINKVKQKYLRELRSTTRSGPHKNHIEVSINEINNSQIVENDTLQKYADVEVLHSNNMECQRDAVNQKQLNFQLNDTARHELLSKRLEVSSNEINKFQEVVIAGPLSENVVKNNTEECINIFEFNGGVLKNVTKNKIGNVENNLEIDNIEVLSSNKIKAQKNKVKQKHLRELRNTARRGSHKKPIEVSTNKIYDSQKNYADVDRISNVPKVTVSSQTDPNQEDISIFHQNPILSKKVAKGTRKNKKCNITNYIDTQFSSLKKNRSRATRKSLKIGSDSKNVADKKMKLSLIKELERKQLTDKLLIEQMQNQCYVKLLMSKAVQKRTPKKTIRLRKTKPKILIKRRRISAKTKKYIHPSKCESNENFFCSTIDKVDEQVDSNIINVQNSSNLDNNNEAVPDNLDSPSKRKRKISTCSLPSCADHFQNVNTRKPISDNLQKYEKSGAKNHDEMISSCAPNLMDDFVAQETNPSELPTTCISKNAIPSMPIYTTKSTIIKLNTPNDKKQIIDAISPVNKAEPNTTSVVFKTLFPSLSSSCESSKNDSLSDWLCGPDTRDGTSNSYTYDEKQDATATTSTETVENGYSEHKNHKTMFIDKYKNRKRNQYYKKLRVACTSFSSSSDSDDDDEFLEDLNRYRTVYISKRDEATNSADSCVSSSDVEPVDISRTFINYKDYRVDRTIPMPLIKQSKLKSMTLGYMPQTDNIVLQYYARKNRPLFQPMRKNAREPVNIHNPVGILATTIEELGVKTTYLKQLDMPNLIENKEEAEVCRLCNSPYKDWYKKRPGRRMLCDIEMSGDVQKSVTKTNKRKRKPNPKHKQTSLKNVSAKENIALADDLMTQYLDQIIKDGRTPKFQCISSPPNPEKRLRMGERCKQLLLEAKQTYETGLNEINNQNMCFNAQRNAGFNSIQNVEYEMPIQIAEEASYEDRSRRTIQVLSNICIKDKRCIQNNSEKNEMPIVDDELLSNYEESDVYKPNEEITTQECNNNQSSGDYIEINDVDFDLFTTELCDILPASESLNDNCVGRPVIRDSVLHTPHIVFHDNSSPTCMVDNDEIDRLCNIEKTLAELDYKDQLAQEAEIIQELSYAEDVTDITDDNSICDDKKHDLYHLTNKQKRSINNFGRKSEELYNHVIRKQQRIIRKHNEKMKHTIKNNNVNAALILKHVKSSLNTTKETQSSAEDMFQQLVDAGKSQMRNFDRISNDRNECGSESGYIVQLDGADDDSSSDDELKVVKKRPTKKMSVAVKSPPKKYPELDVCVQSPSTNFRQTNSISNPCPFSLNEKQMEAAPMKHNITKLDCDNKHSLTEHKQTCDNKVPKKVKRILNFKDIGVSAANNTMVEETVSCRYTPNKSTRNFSMNRQSDDKLSKLNISTNSVNKLSQLNISANLLPYMNILPNINATQSTNEDLEQQPLLHLEAELNLQQNTNDQKLSHITNTISQNTPLQQWNIDTSQETSDINSSIVHNTTNCDNISHQSNISDVSYDSCDLFSPDAINTTVIETETDIINSETMKKVANKPLENISQINKQSSSKTIDQSLTVVEKYDLQAKMIPLAGPSRIEDDTCGSIHLNLRLSLSPKQSGSSSDFSIAPYQSNQQEIGIHNSISLSPKIMDAKSQTTNSGPELSNSLPPTSTEVVAPSKYEYFLNQSMQLTNYNFKTQHSDVSINDESDLDTTLTEKTVDAIHVLMPKFNPPTREYVESTMAQFQLPFVRNEDPYYSDIKDVTGFVDVGPNVLKICSKTIADLPEFKSNFDGILEKQKRQIRAIRPNFTNKELVNLKLSHCPNEDCILEPIKQPPSRRDVELWIIAKAMRKEEAHIVEKLKRIKILIPSSPNSNLDCSLDETLTLSPCSPLEKRIEDTNDTTIDDSIESGVSTEAPLSPILTKSSKRRRLKNKSIVKSLTPTFEQISEPNQSVDDSLRKILLQSHLFNKNFSLSNTGQITGATLNDTHGFKMSLQNLQQVRCVNEHQFLTTLVIELHLQTRADFKPNPEFDSIRAIFYSILNDVPEDYHEPRHETGVFVVNSQLLSPTKGTIKTDVLEGSGVNCDIIYVDTELDLIPKFVDFIRKWDPDIFIGYEIEMLSWGYLIERCYTLGINVIPQLSRIKDVPVARKNPDEELHTELKIPGRIVLDLWRLLKHEMALLSYTFENVVYHILHERVPMYTFKDLTNWWVHKNPKVRHRTVDYYMYRVKATLKLIDQLDFIGRTSELARLFGIQFYEVLSRGSQFRVESMMLRLAKPQNFVPVSPNVQQRAKMRAPEYLPLILEPESKFYKDPVIVLDFQSLYPSIIIAYNYCFSTCIGRVEHLGTNLPFEFGATQLKISRSRVQQLLRRNQLNFSPCGVGFVNKQVRLGIMPRMLQEILDTRLLVKKAMKDDADNKLLQRVLHSRQLGLKLIANVTYGYTAANFSGRMPAVEIGDSVVAKGRETLQRAINLVESTPAWGAKVVYGDTDSLFVLIPGRSRAHAFKIGAEIAEGVTNANPSPVRLKLEKVYQPCILQTKKRYVGYMYESPGQKEPEFQAKGIETVRRDGCPAVSKMLEKCIRLLFDVRDVSLIRKYVLRQFNKIVAGRVSIQDLTFAKEFRGFAGYKPGACVPALELSRKWMTVDKRNEPRSGERVPYVIVNGPPGLPLIRMVRSPRELLADPALRPNALYYITKVIIPPLNRCFKLIGCDMNTWFNEMPRKQFQYLPTSSPSKGRKTTIAQYFATTSCACCTNQTKTGLCDTCQENSQQSTVILYEKIRAWERNYNEINKICQTCCQQPSTSCASLDCPVLYKFTQASRDLQQASYVRDIISQIPELEF